MEELYNKFACLSWLLIEEKELNKIISVLNMKLITNKIIWGKSMDVSTESQPLSTSNIALYEIARIITSPIINGYVIIEGKAINYLRESILSSVSQIYKFNIDIWIPIMSFSYYSQGKKIRECEYTLKEYELITDEKGNKMNFEYQQIELPHWEYGYDDFFYPLSIMQYLGVSVNDIENSFNMNCSVYEIENINQTINLPIDLLI